MQNFKKIRKFDIAIFKQIILNFRFYWKISKWLKNNFSNNIQKFSDFELPFAFQALQPHQLLHLVRGPQGWPLPFPIFPKPRLYPHLVPQWRRQGPHIQNPQGVGVRTLAEALDQTEIMLAGNSMVMMVIILNQCTTSRKNPLSISFSKIVIFLALFPFSTIFSDHSWSKLECTIFFQM